MTVPTLRSRLPEVGTSIFAVMSRLAQEQGAINLSQGFPDFDVPEPLIALVGRAMRDGHNQYAPMPGCLPLRKAIAETASACYGRPIDPEGEVTVTAGATEALYSSIAALIAPGDEAILFDPVYDLYDPAIRLNGGVPIHLPLRPPAFQVDWNEVRRRITPRTKLIVVNNPHNPTGTVLGESDLEALEAIARRHGLFVLSDEVYERIVFDGVPHRSVLARPGLASRSVAVFSFGKTFHATGWKIGYAIAPEAIMQEIRKVHQFVTYCVNTPFQIALAGYLSDPSNVSGLAAFYQRKRDRFLSLLGGSSFEPYPCAGTYFQLVSYRRLSDRPDTEVAEWLTRVHKVAAIPLSPFYGDGTDPKLLRFCFAKKEETLERAGEILAGL
ncbi:MAG TPA: methionine aminotransferase [Candidatus Deferrimicrobiaceae bacterium]|jgi:methionine aminotransferase